MLQFHKAGQIERRELHVKLQVQCLSWINETLSCKAIKLTLMLCISDADLATFPEVEHFEICNFLQFSDLLLQFFTLLVTLKGASVKLVLNQPDFTFWKTGHQKQNYLY